MEQPEYKEACYQMLFERSIEMPQTGDRIFVELTKWYRETETHIHPDHYLLWHSVDIKDFEAKDDTRLIVNHLSENEEQALIEEAGQLFSNLCRWHPNDLIQAQANQ